MEDRAKTKPERHRGRHLLRSSLAAGGGVALLLAAACASMNRTVVVPLQIEGATYIGSAACAECHAEPSRWFSASPHGRRDRGGT